MEAVQMEYGVTQRLDFLVYPIGAVSAHHELLDSLQSVLLTPLKTRALPERHLF